MARSKVKVVTAYVDLGLAKRPSEEFHELGNRLISACGSAVRYPNFPFDDLWLAKEKPPWVAANARAPDRFETDEEHVRSNIVQHSPVQWLRAAYDTDPSPDIFVWISYTVLKQGAFTGKPVKEEHISKFIEKLENWTPDCIPFPGILEKKPVNPHGDNWRFCGSTLIIPKQYLLQVEHSYKYNCMEFIRRHGSIPIDLAIWPSVEENSGLPWRFYRAEYDSTQFTGL